MTVRKCDEAEEIARKYLVDKFGYSGDIEVTSVDFDGNFFLVDGLVVEKEGKTRFTIKVNLDGNVVGWKVM
jgi:hypothetical protein